jgi:hypothetical protein
MNRLSPLIARPPGRLGARYHRAAGFDSRPSSGTYAETAPAGLTDEAKLFASTFLGGLVFFSTFLA